MQKISCYLVPNRTIVVLNAAGFNTEFRQVYTRTIKLYKGITNTLEFDVRNNEQKKQSILGKTPKLVIFDLNQQQLLEKSGTIVPGTQHLFTVELTAAELAMIDTQHLRLALKVVSGAQEQMLYGDSQFGLHINADLLNGFNSLASQPQEIKVFNYTFNYQTLQGLYTSEVAEFSAPLNDDTLDSTRTANVTIYPGEFRGDVTVEVTKDKSTSSSNFWTALDQKITVDGPGPIDAVVSNDQAYTYMRFKFLGYRGLGAAFNISRSNGEYIVSLVQRGTGYTVGDTLTILGSKLGGDDGVNDLRITVTDVNTYPPGAMQLNGFTWEGLAAELPPSGLTYYKNVMPDAQQITKTIDKIIVRS